MQLLIAQYWRHLQHKQQITYYQYTTPQIPSFTPP